MSTIVRLSRIDQDHDSDINITSHYYTEKSTVICLYYACDIIQLMTFDEVNTRIDQLMEHDIHLGIRGEYHVPCVDQSEA